MRKSNKKTSSFSRKKEIPPREVSLPGGLLPLCYALKPRNSSSTRWRWAVLSSLSPASV